MKDLGFRQSVTQPSVYIHDQQQLYLVVHVDDFLVSGDQEALDWVYKTLSRQWELKKCIVSCSPDDAHETSYLNRR